MRNILADNKTLKQFNNVEFVNHIMRTSHLHQVASLKVFELGMKSILKEKQQLLKEYEEHQEKLKKENKVSIAFHIPSMIQIIEEMQTAFNIKYNQE
jgi:GTPase involved in cell partitioning and DNA repair